MRSIRASSLYEALFRPVDAAWLAALRIVFGCVLGASMLRFIAYGWIDRFFVAPRFHFKYWGFGWIEPLSGPHMNLLFWALAGLAFMIAIGCCFRVCALLFAIGLSYVQLIDVTTYLNHYYLAALLAWLLSVSPAHRMWSVDAWLRGPRLHSEHVPAWVLYLARFQVGVVYTFAGLAKLQSDWLLHAQPLRIWLGASTDLPWIGPTFTWPWVPLAMSWAGFLFDTTIVWWLAWSRTRVWAYAAVIGFHVLTRVLFPIGMFPLIMVAAALVFFSPDWPRRWLARIAAKLGRPARQPALAPQAIVRVRTRDRVWVALAAGYCLVQLALPLRHLPYGGNVMWHEQGMRFSWRVMLRAKGGSTTFIVRDRSSGRTFHVSPRQYLSDMQESEMSSQPDLILQLAHHIRADYERRGFGPLEVHVDSRASLNGRRSAPLIDPAVDLTTIRDGLAQASWVLPAPSQPPPHTRPVL